MFKRWSTILLVIAGLVGQAVALAANTPSSAQGLEISPPVIELSANPGQTVIAQVKLRNVTKAAIFVTGKSDDFGAKGEDGEPKILLDETESTRYSLKFWVPNVPTLTLQPQEQKTISMPINVPSNAEPGGHYGVIRFSGRPAELSGDESAVSLSASLGSLVLLRVSGDIHEGANIIDFYASNGGHRGWFFENGPIDFVQRLQNTGTVHTKPTGTLTVYSIFGRKVGELAVNDPARNVLPDSIRRFDETLKNKFLFGRYRAQVNLTYGPDKTPLSKTIVFWVIPWKLLIMLLVVLIALFFVIRQSLRNYNRRLIEKYKRQR